MSIPRDDAVRVLTEVAAWRQQTNYKHTPDDEAVLRGVVSGTMRSLFVKAGIGGALGATAGLLAPRLKAMPFKIPLSAALAAGMLAGVYIDNKSKPSSVVSSWLFLLRNTNTPLSEKFYSTLAEVSPSSEAGKIAKSRLDIIAQQLPFTSQEGGPAQRLPTQPQVLPQYKNPTYPAGVDTPMRNPTSVYQTGRGPGSGFYDITGTGGVVSRTGSQINESPHRPGTGFYDVKTTGYDPSPGQLHPHRKRGVHAPETDDGELEQTLESPIETLAAPTIPTPRSVFVRPIPTPPSPPHPTLPTTRYTAVNRDDELDAPQKKGRVNKYGDDFIL